MKSELLAGSALAVVVAISCLVVALFAGAGVATCLVIYSLSGSVALVAGALWGAYLHERREMQIRADPAGSVLAQ